MELLTSYHRQGYEVFMDNFYTSHHLLMDLEAASIRATGQKVPSGVKQLQTTLKSSTGTGFYVREPGNSAIFVCWQDNDCVTPHICSLP